MFLRLYVCSLKGNSRKFSNDGQQKRKEATAEVRYAARYLRDTYRLLAEREAKGMADMAAKSEL